MTTATQNTKSSEPTPLYALVGATDLAIESVRHALADATRRQAEIQAQFEHLQTELTKRRNDVQKLLSEPKRLQAELEQVPGLVLGRTMEAAARAETRYEELATRGKTLVERLDLQKTTQDLVESGKATLSRTRAAVTTARQTAGDVATSARETFAAGRRETATTAEATETEATETEATETEATETEATETEVETAAETAAEAVVKTATATRKRIARTRPVTKDPATKDPATKKTTTHTRKHSADTAQTSAEAEQGAAEASPGQGDE
jgi:heparin binding hemagglutinin HbhA